MTNPYLKSKEVQYNQNKKLIKNQSDANNNLISKYLMEKELNKIKKDKSDSNRSNEDSIQQNYSKDLLK